MKHLSLITFLDSVQILKKFCNVFNICIDKFTYAPYIIFVVFVNNDITHSDLHHNREELSIAGREISH